MQSEPAPWLRALDWIEHPLIGPRHDFSGCPYWRSTDLKRPAAVVREIDRRSCQDERIIADSIEEKLAVSSNDIQQLEHRLQQREEVIKALTARLEQAAEQLDRYRRGGVARGGSEATAPEAGPAQRELNRGLTRFLEEWDEIRPGEALTRVEEQLAALHELIQHGSWSTVSRRPSLGADPALSEDSEDADDQAADEADAEEDALSAWEAMKASLLGGAAPAADSPKQPTAPSEPTTTPAPETNSESSAINSESPTTAPVETSLDEPSELAAPQPVDGETATRDELAAAVLVRDEYIQFLLRKLRHSQPAVVAPEQGWKSLEGVPEQLVAELERLQERLDEQVRRNEVEFSLERARLAREASRLEAFEQRLKKDYQLGDESDAAGPAEAAASPPETVSARRWMKFLGVSNDDE